MKTTYSIPWAVILILLMAYWKHRQNIVRLIHGEERKTYLSKKNEV